MIYMIAQYVHKAIEAATPWLVGTAEFVSYAWKIAKHESKEGVGRVYNQFNASENQYKELPNWGTHNRAFLSPLQFDPQTGRWIFHQNTTNPNYVRDVMTDASLQEVE